MKDDNKYWTGTFEDTGAPPSVVMYMAQTWPPPAPPPSVPGISIYPVPNTLPPDPLPSSTEQEIGALKERVGRMEEEMRKLVKKFLNKRRKK